METIEIKLEASDFIDADFGCTIGCPIGKAITRLELGRPNVGVDDVSIDSVNHYVVGVKLNGEDRTPLFGGPGEQRLGFTADEYMEIKEIFESNPETNYIISLQQGKSYYQRNNKTNDN